MMKYRKILKAALLITVVSGFVPEAFGSSPAPGSEFEVDAGRFHLLSGPVRTPGSDQRHQVKSAELQERIRSVQRCWLEGDARTDGAVDYQGIFVDLIYTKFKTVYDLGSGPVARPLETTTEEFMKRLEV